MIVSGEKTEELRQLKQFWIDRLFCDNPPEIAVFVCGSRVHRRIIDAVYFCVPEEILNRELSEQGKKDIQSDVCIVVELGEGQCDRCFCWTDKIIPHRWKETENPSYGYEEIVEMNTCWSCDHDIINGGDPFENEFDIEERRRVEAYEEDPVNNPYPY